MPPYLFSNYQPLICGTLVCWMDLLLREIAISLANGYDAILSTADLYNAAKQVKLLASSWPGMDFLISIHTPECLFVEGLPTQPEDFFKQLYLAHGAGVANVARNRRKAKFQRNRDCSVGRELKNKVNLPIHDIFRGRYSKFGAHADLSSEKIDLLIESKLVGSLKCADGALIRGQWAAARKLTSVQLPQVLRASLEHDETHLRFDYVSMHTQCVMFLKKIFDDINSGATKKMDEVHSANRKFTTARV